jgi:uncharacterized protein (DUF488 family)
MLTRERIALRVLEEAGEPIAKTVFVKLMFLLRMETELKQHSSFYDFVPYKYGPFSFALYRDLYRLELHGYVSEGGEEVTLNDKLYSEAQIQTEKLAHNLQSAVVDIVENYGQMKLSPLIKNVYGRYPWYALNSERKERKLFVAPPRPKAAPAVYTIGYEGKTVDAFFNFLLEKGIATIVDVRANPVSRKYGFAKSRMKQIGTNVGIDYLHFPTLGVSSRRRADLSDKASRARLFDLYELTTLVDRKEELKELARIMQTKPSVLVCVEEDVDSCHRGRLSHAIADDTGMEVIHL